MAKKDSYKEEMRAAVVARMKEMQGSLDVLSGMWDLRTLETMVLAFGIGRVEINGLRPDTTIEKGLKMDPEAKKFIEELKAHAVAETAEWMADSNHSQEPDRKPEDHIAWQAAAWLQAIFDPENQPSQYGTCLADQVI